MPDEDGDEDDGPLGLERGMIGVSCCGDEAIDTWSACCARNLLSERVWCEWMLYAIFQEYCALQFSGFMFRVCLGPVNGVYHAPSLVSVGRALPKNVNDVGGAAASSEQTDGQTTTPRVEARRRRRSRRCG